MCLQSKQNEPRSAGTARHFKNELLVIQHEIQAHQATRQVLTVESNVNVEDVHPVVSDSAGVKSPVVETEQSYANTVNCLQLVSALHELDKSYSETFQSVNALTYHFKNEVLVIQHEIQAHQATGEVLTVESNVNVEDVHPVVSDSAGVKSPVVETEQTCANTVGYKTSVCGQMSSCGMTAAVYSRSVASGAKRTCPSAAASTAASTASTSCEASGAHTHTHTQYYFKRIKFQHRPGRVGFISDSTFKFLVENERMQTYLIRNNFEKNVFIAVR